MVRPDCDSLEAGFCLEIPDAKMAWLFSEFVPEREEYRGRWKERDRVEMWVGSEARMSVTEGWRDAEEERNKNTRASAVGRLVTLSGGKLQPRKNYKNQSAFKFLHALCVLSFSLTHTRSVVSVCEISSRSLRLIYWQTGSRRGVIAQAPSEVHNSSSLTHTQIHTDTHTHTHLHRYIYTWPQTHIS